MFNTQLKNVFNYYNLITYKRLNQQIKLMIMCLGNM